MIMRQLELDMQRKQTHLWRKDLFQRHMGGCQNYGPFLGPYYNTAPNI